MILREKFVCSMAVLDNKLTVAILIATSADYVRDLQDCPLKN
jgi:hypothetical protein